MGAEYEENSGLDLVPGTRFIWGLEPAHLDCHYETSLSETMKSYAIG